MFVSALAGLAAEGAAKGIRGVPDALAAAPVNAAALASSPVFLLCLDERKPRAAGVFTYERFELWADSILRVGAGVEGADGDPIVARVPTRETPPKEDRF